MQQTCLHYRDGATPCPNWSDSTNYGPLAFPRSLDPVPPASALQISSGHQTALPGLLRKPSATAIPAITIGDKKHAAPVVGGAITNTRL